MLTTQKNIPLVKQLELSQFTLKDLATMQSKQSHAHRHDFYTLIYVKDGIGKQLIDYEEVDIVAHRVYFLSPKKVHYWNATCKGNAMMINAEFLQNDTKIMDTLFVSFKNTVYIDIKKEHRKTFEILLNVLVQSYNAEHSKALVSSLLTSFLLFCIEIKKTTKEESEVLLPSRLLHIYELIEKHYIDENNASFYAKNLGMSIQHLNRVLKTSSGKTLAQLLRERRVLEAKRELVFTSKTIDAISESLGFFDTSNFTKYFKNITKFSPSKFREMFKKYH
jgi:AraC-like DNA-binding protein